MSRVLLARLFLLFALAACTGTETGNPEAPIRDAGNFPEADAGGPFDGGATFDAGQPPADAGQPPADAGQKPPEDAGSSRDAAAEEDSGADAG